MTLEPKDYIGRSIEIVRDAFRDHIAREASSPAGIVWQEPDPQSGTAVWFPLLGEAPTVGVCYTAKIDRLESDRYAQQVGGDSSVEQAVKYSRAREATTAAMLQKVVIRFVPQKFTGNSCGLAVAISDRIARYGRTADPSIRIVATGTLMEGGRVGAVHDIAQKLRLILAAWNSDATTPRLVVLLPRDHPSPSTGTQDTPAEREDLVEALRAKGAEVRLVGRIDDLDDLWGGANPSSPHPTVPTKPQAPRRARPYAIGAALGVVAVVVVAAIAWFRDEEKDWAYESDIQPLRTQVAVLAAGLEPEGCRGLLGLHDSLSSEHRQRIAAEEHQVFQVAERCRTALVQSEVRWAAVLAAFQQAVGEQPAAARALIAAVNALSAFDRERLDAEEPEDYARALAAGAAAQAALDAASTKAKAAVGLIERLDDEGVTAALCLDLVQQIAAMEVMSRGLLVEGRTDAETIRAGCAEALAASRARWAELAQRAERFASEAAAESAEALAEAYAALTSFDLAAPYADPAAAHRAVSAVQALAESDSRLEALLRTAASWQPGSVSHTSASIEAALASITDFDRSRYTVEHREAERLLGKALVIATASAEGITAERLASMPIILSIAASDLAWDPTSSVKQLLTEAGLVLTELPAEAIIALAIDLTVFPPDNSDYAEFSARVAAHAIAYWAASQVPIVSVTEEANGIDSTRERAVRRYAEAAVRKALEKLLLTWAVPEPAEASRDD